MVIVITCFNEVNIFFTKGYLVGKQKSESGSGHLVIVVFLVVALLGMLGFVFWQNYMKPKVNNNPTDAKTIVNTTANARTIVSGINDLLNTKYSSSTIKIKFNPSGSGSPIYKPNEANYFVMVETSPGLIIDTGSFDSTVNSPVLTDIDNYLNSQHFTKDDSLYTGMLSSEGHYYNSSTVICSLDGGVTAQPISLYCANIADFTPVTAAVKPFVQAYYLNNKSDIGNVAFMTPSIKTSNTAGYQFADERISFGLGGMDAYFYKKDGDDWKYFTRTQQTMCNVFDTTEMRAAFAGETCYDSSGNSTIVK